MVIEDIREVSPYRQNLPAQGDGMCNLHLHMDKALPFSGRTHSSSLNSLWSFMLYLFPFYSSLITFIVTLNL